MARRKMYKAAAVLIALGYCSLLVYQGGVTFNFQESRAVPVQVSDLTIEPVTKISVLQNASKNITLEDIFISVKTSRHYQRTRLPVILKTWFQLAKEQIWFFTDIDNPSHQQQTNNHMINTNCSDTHQRKHLCCKTSVEYDHYLLSGKKWWCHFDDDNYVNVPRLVTFLQKYNPQEEWFFGRASVNKPVNLYNKTNNKRSSSFWFATGGAGYCISRSLALKMIPAAGDGKFISVCEGIRLPDDVTMGFLIEHFMSTNMTNSPEFHSHLEQMKLIPLESFRDQVSFSYGIKNNVISVPGFDAKYDPTRFLSLHCFLFPHFEFCPR